jgi:hypothetical protein
MEVRQGRSESYVCSLDTDSIIDMTDVLTVIKRSVKAHNSRVAMKLLYTKSARRRGYNAVFEDSFQRISIKGREAKEKQFINVNGWRSVPDNRLRSYDMYGDIVGDKYTNAKRLDIYVHDDTGRTWKAKEELDTIILGDM